MKKVPSVHTNLILRLGMILACCMLSCTFFIATAMAGPQDFTLANESSSNICYVFISPNNKGDWEEDVLGKQQCLAPGESIEITFNAGKQAMWDLRVQDNEENYEEYYGINLMEVSKVTIQGGGEATTE